MKTEYIVQWFKGGEWVSVLRLYDLEQAIFEADYTNLVDGYPTRLLKVEPVSKRPSECDLVSTSVIQEWE